MFVIAQSIGIAQVYGKASAIAIRIQEGSASLSGAADFWPIRPLAGCRLQVVDVKCHYM